MDKTLTENISYCDKNSRILIIACGALAKEIIHIREINNMQNIMDIQCLPAILHNRPEKIPRLLENKIIENQGQYKTIMIGYADCGSAGQIQQICSKYNVSLITGSHCYEFFSGTDNFNKIQNQELGTFYLTDYLVRHFDSLIIKAYKLDKIPEMKNMLFNHYKKVVYIAQTDNNYLNEKAKSCADFLELSYERVITGYGELETFIKQGV
ncbi:MAG: DUF1638 domain-containing protein [Alphaproteobacteria bacterium]|nr:DUF1638 domain-containing protein [Alphaproteobacteria bacterium]